MGSVKEEGIAEGGAITRLSFTAPGKRLLYAGGLDVVNTDEAQLIWRDAIQLQRNIDVAGCQHASRGGEQLILYVHFLIAFGRR